MVPSRGTVHSQVRATLRVDWRHAPTGTTEVPITVTGSQGSSVVVQAVVQNPDVSRRDLRGFVESNGYVCMNAASYTVPSTATG